MFENPNFLLDFQFLTIRSVQTFNDAKFETWRDAPEYMKNEINNTDFDIALVGCGAYGIFV